MTGSVHSDTHGAQSAAANTGKSDKPRQTAVKKTKQSRDSPPSTRKAKDSDKTSSSLLPPLAVNRSPKVSDSRRARSTSHATATSLANSPTASRKPPSFNRTTSIPPAHPKMMDENVGGSLARRGRAQSHLALNNSSALDPIFNIDDREFTDSYGAKSELSVPVSRRLKREARNHGTMERATSYSSLSMRPGPLFRSANSARPPPAPPCTTTDLEYCRHPVHPVNSRLVRRGTPRGNNPHPVGLHFQSPYNRDGKTFEVWNPDVNVISSRLPQMCNHIGETNFSSGKMKAYTPERSGPLESHYSTASVYRSSYQQPQRAVDYDERFPTTRFGSTLNRVPAMGVVPNVMSPRTARVKLHVPRGRKLESLV